MTIRHRAFAKSVLGFCGIQVPKIARVKPASWRGRYGEKRHRRAQARNRSRLVVIRWGPGAAARSLSPPPRNPCSPSILVRGADISTHLQALSYRTSQRSRQFRHGKVPLLDASRWKNQLASTLPIIQSPSDIALDATNKGAETVSVPD